MNGRALPTQVRFVFHWAGKGLLGLGLWALSFTVLELRA